MTDEERIENAASRLSVRPPYVLCSLSLQSVWMSLRRMANDFLPQLDLSLSIVVVACMSRASTDSPTSCGWKNKEWAKNGCNGPHAARPTLHTHSCPIEIEIVAGLVGRSHDI